MKFSEWLTINEHDGIWGMEDRSKELIPILSQFNIDTMAQNQLALAISTGLTKGMNGTAAASRASKLLTASQMQLVNFIRNNK